MIKYEIVTADIKSEVKVRGFPIGEASYRKASLVKVNTRGM